MVHSITDAEFEKVLKDSEYVLVDFWAPWCGPCRQFTPILESFASEVGNKIRVCKMNIDENPEAPTKLGVRSIPTLMLFKDGKLLETKVGSLPKVALQEWVESKVETE